MKNRTKRFLCLLITLAMLLASLPAVAFAASTPAILYLTPNDNWKVDSARFAAYFFGNGETWVSMTDSNGDGIYEAAVPTGFTSVIFCRMNPSASANNWDNKWNQTADLSIPTNGNNHYTVAADTWDNGGGSWSVFQEAEYPSELYLIPNSNWKSDNARFAAYFFGNGEAWVSMTDSNGDGVYEVAVPEGYSQVIFCRMDPNATANNWDNKWNQTADLSIPTDGNNCYTVAEGAWDKGSGSWSTYTPPADITCQVTLHFADSLGWSNVYLYTWIGSSNHLGSWPGTQAGLDEDGFYTVTFQAQIPGGRSLNFIFNNGGNGCQTVDLSIPYSDLESGSVEKWVQPTTKYEDEDSSNAKYNCDMMDSADAAVQSPVVNGTSVTFEYKDTSASSVKVAGSWNSWTQLSMTKNTYGVWSITVTDLTPGVYQYKFVADGSWVSDPVNPWIMTEDQNSAFIVLDPNAEDQNEVTVKLHYNRADGNYSGWNAWIWTLNAGAGQYDLTNEDGHMTATITVPGRSTRYVSYIMRYSTAANKWEQQEYGERRVDLSDIVSGTVHCYVNSGEYTAVRVLDTDVVQGNKISAVNFDYASGNKIAVTTTRALADPETELSISGDIAIEGITTLGSTYTLTLNKSLSLDELYQYKILFDGYAYDIAYTSAYATDRFAAEYTYEGDDLGATWSKSETTFRVWAPTAADVKVNLYRSGTAGTNDLINAVPMSRDVNGTWVVTVDGDLNGTYYTYAVNVDGETVEAVDPYARTTGVNGKRGMIIDLDSTDPEDWENDTNPNPSTSYTDAVIYELHVRDFSIDDSSGIIEDYQGKFLAFTQEGSTVNGEGSIATGIDYLKELGITHLHLLPVYDYGSVDETTCDSFNWGYDPVNYNTPEGSYSTDPYKGEVRVSEFKQMVKALHEAGISVVMDVVYNHVYDGDQFCLNQIVPGYFSRQNADGSYSNSSGCGNDTASEREMVRKYIVDSVTYWTEEYHIDGFRFDLVGLIDVDTINLLIEEIHANRPDVIFYGEGWTLGGAVEPGTQMATQANAKLTPEMAYFNDRIRDAMGGYNGTATGFISGNSEKSEQLADNFRAITDYTTDPQQLIQYISCHDNHTLMAKILLSTGKSAIDADAVKMNDLAAAIYLTAQGIPFIHAGEEMLRLKINPDGSFNENSYNSDDGVNAIDWSNLQAEMYADTSDYYKGLIAFRKTHPALRYATASEISQNVTTVSVSDSLVCFQINGTAANDLAETIYVIFNAGTSAATVSLPTGTWNVCIDGENAGADTLYTASGSVSVSGISAMVLVQNEAQAAAEVNGVKYATVQAAADAATGKTVKLLTDSTETVTATGDLYLDLNGKSLTGLNISQGILYGMDSTTDDYDCTDGYGTIGTLSGTAAVTHSMDGKSYLKVSDKSISFHRYYVGITHVTLNPASTGVGYRAVFAGDTVVQAQLDTQEAYGYNLWLDPDRVVTRSAGIDKFRSGKTVTLLLKNYDVENYGTAPVYAQVYLKLADGTVINSHVSDYSLQQLVESVSANLGSFTAAQLEAVQQLCNAHSEATASWNIQALLNWNNQ